MSGLSATLSAATQSLLAQELELQVTNNNIANSNTVGYSRETVTLTEASASQSGGITIGNGVDVRGITSVRDELLDRRIQQQTSQQGSADAQVNALNQLQTLFPSTGSSLASSLSSFFTSLSALSANPADPANRQTAISSAQSLVDQFHTISAGLSGPGNDLDTNVKTDVQQINQLSAEAASLNQQTVQLKAAGQDTGAVGDQLNHVESQLASLTNLNVTHTTDGDSITTANGTPLVLGNQSYALTTGAGSDGHLQIIDAGGANITANITGGDLGGTLQVRDVQIPALTSNLDTLATQFATAFNQAQTQGFDQSGKPGTALFSVPAGGTGAAAGIQLVTKDATAIAASSDGSTASNGNIKNLLAIQNTAPAAGQSVTVLSSNLVYQIGNLTANATAQSSAVKLSLTSLNNQQSSVSGVSIDEESTNLIRFQQAYQAAAKVVSTIQTLFDTTINMIN